MDTSPRDAEQPERTRASQDARRAAGSVCVLGLGLIGGSLLRRLDAVAEELSTGGAAAGPAGDDGAEAPRAFGWNRSAATVDAAGAAGHDVSTDLEATLDRARAEDALVVVGVPMPAVAPLLAEVARIHPDAQLTDVVSVKGPVRDAVHAAGLGAGYVGSHPMAGTNSTGWAATDPELFAGSTWVITSDGGGAESTWRRVAALGASTGSRLLALPSDEHDRAVARISHLPHVLAEALAVSGKEGGDAALALGAGSFRDGTRVAGTPPDLVRAICEPNAAALEQVLADAVAELGAALDQLRHTGSLGDLIDRGSAGRAAFEAARREPGTGAREIAIGAPGWLDTAVAAGRRGQTISVAF